MTAALPVSVAPRPGESIESWLEPLADANGLTTAQLLTATGRGRAGTRFLTLAPSPATITRLAALARVDEQDVYAATLAAFDGTALDLTGLDPLGTRPRHPDLPHLPRRDRRMADRVAAPDGHRLHPPR